MRLMFSAILTAGMLATLASCGGSSSTSQPPAASASTPSPTPSPISTAEQTFA
jgi:hypothetical protein